MGVPRAAAVAGLLVISAVTNCDRYVPEPSLSATAACAACTVELVRELTLAAPGVLMPHAQVAQDSAGRYYVSPTVDRWRIAVFDSRGVLIRFIGSPGGGPGEFGEVRRIGIGPGDSLTVIHDFNRVSVFGPTGRFGRSYTLATTSSVPSRFHIDSDGSMLALRGGSVEGEVDYPARWFSSTGEPREGYGQLARYGEGPRYGALDVDKRGVWFATFQPLSIHRYKAVGDSADVLANSDWYLPRGMTVPGVRGLQQRVSHIAAASDTTLWVLGWRARPQVAETSGSSAGEATPRMLSTAEVAARNEAILDLIDFERRTLVVRHSLGSQVPGGFLGSDRLYTYAEAGDGEVEIHIWRVVLVSGRR